MSKLGTINIDIKVKEEAKLNTFIDIAKMHERRADSVGRVSMYILAAATLASLVSLLIGADLAWIVSMIIIIIAFTVSVISNLVSNKYFNVKLRASDQLISLHMRSFMDAILGDLKKSSPAPKKKAKRAPQHRDANGRFTKAPKTGK